VADVIRQETEKGILLGQEKTNTFAGTMTGYLENLTRMK
jgi:hypothetical protein